MVFTVKVWSFYFSFVFLLAKGGFIGIVITVLRACYVDNNIYVCDERKRDYTNDPDRFYQLLEFCWALKVINTTLCLLSLILYIY